MRVARCTASRSSGPSTITTAFPKHPRLTSMTRWDLRQCRAPWKCPQIVSICFECTAVDPVGHPPSWTQIFRNLECCCPRNLEPQQEAVTHPWSSNGGDLKERLSSPWRSCWSLKTVSACSCADCWKRTIKPWTTSLGTTRSDFLPHISQRKHPSYPCHCAITLLHTVHLLCDSPSPKPVMINSMLMPRLSPVWKTCLLNLRLDKHPHISTDCLLTKQTYPCDELMMSPRYCQGLCLC